MKNILFVLALIGILISCNQAPKKTEKKTKMDTAVAKNEIVGKYWKLTTLEGKPIAKLDGQVKERYFMLTEDKTVSGFAGCNSFNGEYELSEGNRLRFKENMAVTMMACPDLDIDESEYLKVFSLTDNYTIRDEILSLNVGRRAPLAVFEEVLGAR